MLSFEEFFHKKKINLLQLQQQEPVLFAEFSRHYPLMGEKSFDHTKKYHFNNLRRNYPLPLTAKPHPVQAEAISNIAVQGIAVAAAQNLGEGIEKPKFKEDHLVELSAQNVPEADISLAEAEQVILETKPETEVPKPAFKPRFNSKIIIKTEEAESVVPETQAPITETEKPSFKPKFNIQNIKKDVVKTVSDTEVHLPNVISEDMNALQEATDQSEQIVKPAFKPRFNPKNSLKPTPAITQETEMQHSAQTDVNIAKADELKPDLDSPDIKNQSIKTASANEVANTEASINRPKPEKTAYKPRFQAKNIPKPPTSLE